MWKVAVGKRSLGEALCATNPSMRMWKGMAHKSEAVHREGLQENVGSWVWSSQADVGQEMERQLPSRPSCLRGSPHAPQLEDLDTNLYKEV